MGSERKSKLSIIIVTKNASRNIRKTLFSLQTNLKELISINSEIIIVDGESKDDTLAIINEYNYIINIPIYIYIKTAKGIYDAMNYGISKSESEWILFLNSGDTLQNTKQISNDIYNAEQLDKKCILYQSAIHHPSLRIGFSNKLNNDICHEALIYRRILHQEFGYYRTDLKIISDQLYIKKLPKSYFIYKKLLLTALEVSPENRSRNPSLIDKDYKLFYTKEEYIRKKDKLNSRIYLLLLHIEKTIGISIFVWIKAIIKYIARRNRIVILNKVKK